MAGSQDLRREQEFQLLGDELGVHAAPEPRYALRIDPEPSVGDALQDDVAGRVDLPGGHRAEALVCKLDLALVAPQGIGRVLAGVALEAGVDRIPLPDRKVRDLVVAVSNRALGLVREPVPRRSTSA